MASSIDKNPHNPLTHHESAQPQVHEPQGAGGARSTKDAKPTPQKDEPKETFSTGPKPGLQKSAVSQPMLGAFAKAPAKTATKATGAQGTGTLVEQQNVLNAANNIIAKTSGAQGLARKAAGGAGVGALGVGALGVSLAMPILVVPAAIGAMAVASGAGLLARRSAKQAVSNSSDLQNDVEVLKAARDRISQLDNPSQIEKATLNAAEKGLAGVKG